MFSGIKLDLPKTKKVNNLRLTKKQVILSIANTGDLLLGGEKFLQTEIVDEVLSRFKEHSTDVLYLRADYKINYGEVARMIALLKKGGIAKIALVTEIEKNS